MKNTNLPVSTTVKKQVKKLTFNDFRIEGGAGILKVEIRYDDQCGNGHNSFAITGALYRDYVTEQGFISGGCIHDDILTYAPKEISDLIEWHLFDSHSGPMHYVSNTMYHAKDTDSNGYKKGEPCAWKEQFHVNKSPMPTSIDKKLVALLKDADKLELLKASKVLPVVYVGDYDFSPKYTLSNGVNATRWHDSEFDTIAEAEAFLDTINNHSFEFITSITDYSQGKTPDLEAARRCANWPEATLEQLNDKEALVARLPAMMERFKDAVESLGFIY